MNLTNQIAEILGTKIGYYINYMESTLWLYLATLFLSPCFSWAETIASFGYWKLYVIYVGFRVFCRAIFTFDLRQHSYEDA